MLKKSFGPPKFLAHIKIESKISDLGKKNYILHRQMTEKMSLEVGVKKWSKIGKVHLKQKRMLIFVPKSLILLSIFMWAKIFGGPKDFLSKKNGF